MEEINAEMGGGRDELVGKTRARKGVAGEASHFQSCGTGSGSTEDGEGIVRGTLRKHRDDDM